MHYDYLIFQASQVEHAVTHAQTYAFPAFPAILFGFIYSVLIDSFIIFYYQSLLFATVCSQNTPFGPTSIKSNSEFWILNSSFL